MNELREEIRRLEALLIDKCPTGKLKQQALKKLEELEVLVKAAIDERIQIR